MRKKSRTVNNGDGFGRRGEPTRAFLSIFVEREMGIRVSM